MANGAQLTAWLTGETLTEGGIWMQSYTGSVALSSGRGVVNALLAPAGRSVEYLANDSNPNVIPSIEAILHGYHSGLISGLSMPELLRSHGVPCYANPGTNSFIFPNTKVGQAWRAVLANAKTAPPFPLLRSLWVRAGRPDEPNGRWVRVNGVSQPSLTYLKAILESGGIGTDPEQDAMLTTGSFPGVGAVLDFRNLGLITNDEADLELDGLGYFRAGDRQKLLNVTQVISTDIVLWLYNRGMLTQQQARDALYNLGYIDDNQANRVMASAQSLPQARESLALGLPHIQNDAIAGKYGLDKEFAPELEDWLRGAGRWWGPPVNLPDNPGQAIPRQAAELWRSHWQMPSPAAAATMYQRLRPDAIDRLRNIRANGGGLLFPNLQEFTPDDFYKCMQASGIPPALRDQLTAVSFTPLSQRILQRSVFFGLADGNRVTSSFLDLGYSPPDAQLASDTITAAARWQQDAPARSIQQSAVRHLIQLAMDQYGTGQIDRNAAAARIEGLGISAGAIDDLLTLAATTRPVELNAKLNESAVSGGIKEVMRLYEMGAISDAEASSYLTPWGLSQPTVRAMLLQANLRTRSDVARAGISSLRSDYRAGLLSDAVALARLQGFGITPQRAANYVAQWRAGMSDIRRRLNTQQIIKFVQDGLITFDAAASRLANLGWAQPDILIWLAAARQQIDSANARALKAAQLTAKKAAAEAARIHKEQAAAQEKLLNKLKSELRPSDLKKWFKDGIITADEYAAQLKLYGYPDAVIARIIGDVFKPPEVLSPVPSGGQPIQKPPQQGG